MRKDAGQEVVTGTAVGPLVSCLMSLQGVVVEAGTVRVDSTVLSLCFWLLIGGWFKPGSGAIQDLRRGKIHRQENSKAIILLAVWLRFAALYFISHETVNGISSITFF